MLRKNLVIVSFLVFLCSLLNAQQWLWVKPAGGTNLDYAHAVATDLTGNVFVTGSYEGTGNFGTTQLTNSGQKDMFIVKYNSQGTVQWAKKAGGTGVEEGLGVVVDDNGDCYITGYFTGTITFATGTSFTSSNGKDIFIAKYSGSNGTLVWAKKIGVTGDAEGSGIVLDNAGNFYITGYFRNTASFKTTAPTISLTAAGGLDAYVAKFNSSGICLWAKKAGGTSLDRSYGIALNRNQLVITGYYEGTGTFGSTQLTSAGSGDAFVAKYDTAGGFVWAKSFGGGNTDYGHAVGIDTVGNVYVTGRFEVQATFLTTPLTSYGGYDIFLAKLNNNGNLNWVNKFGGLFLDFTKSMVLNNGNDALYITGAYALEATFGNTTLTSATNSQDMFAIKTDTSGNVLWATDGGGLYDDEGNGITADAFGVVYTVGSFYNNTVVFGSLNVSGYAEYDAFTAKICPLSAQVIKTNVSCHGLNDGTVIIIPEGGTPPFSYSWLPNISSNDTVENVSAGTYDITVSDDNGCMTVVQAVIEEPLAMNLTATGHDVLCHNDNNGYATILASGGTTPYNYSWNTLPVQTNDTAMNLSQGTYKVIVTDGGGCKDSAVVIIANPPVVNAYAGQNKSVCSGNAVTIGATPAATGGTPPYSYLWTPATYLNFDTLANPVATPTSNINYLLKVTDKNGCFATDEMSVSITQPPAVMISQNDTLCLGETTNLAANASGALSYQWAPAASLSNAGIQTPVAAPTVTTTYTVTVSFSGNCYNTNTVKIVVNPLPQITTSGNQSVCEGDSLQLTASGGAVYVWQPSGLLYNANISNPQTHPLTSDATFTVTVTDANLCVNTAQLSITVNPVPSPAIVENMGVLTSNYVLGNQWYLNGTQIQNATGQNYTPTQDGNYTVAVTINNCTGVSLPYTMINVSVDKTLGKQGIAIYPNPAKNELHIEIPAFFSEKTNILLKNILGKVLIEKNIAISTKTILNLSALNSGIYFVEVRNGNDVFVYKILKF